MRWGAVLFAIALVGGAAAGAAEAPSLAAQLGGKTLSAVVYVPRNAANGGGALQRLVLQAYLEADGRALVRQWQSADNRYSAPARTRWSLTNAFTSAFQELEPIPRFNATAKLAGFLENGSEDATANYLEAAATAALAGKPAAKGETLARGCKIRWTRPND